MTETDIHYNNINPAAPTGRRTLEVCCGDIDSVIAAVEGGAERVELSSALSEGGVTAAPGFVRQVRKMFPALTVHLLIRHRGGDFVSTPEEIEIMCGDIRYFKDDADAFVIGALTPEGDIDEDATARMIEAAGGKSITYSRAFDRVRDPESSLEKLIALGCDRILTSGVAPSAYAGIDTLEKLNRQSDGRITLIAAAGVNSGNAREILQRTGLREIHASARKAVASPVTYRNPEVTMGAKDADEFTRLVTDPREVRAIIAEINRQ